MKKILFPVMFFFFIAIGCSVSALPSVSTPSPLASTNTPILLAPTQTSAPATPTTSTLPVPTQTSSPVLPPPVAIVQSFVHFASSGNIANNWTYLDSSLTNNTPNVLVLVTSNWNPAGVGGTYNDHAIGVWYESESQKWAVYNQDMAAMPIDAAFNVQVPPAGTTGFVHTANAGNIVDNWTYIDSPLTTNIPNAIVFVTSNWNPGDVGGTYNDHEIGVWYDSSAQKWAIYNQDIASMPVGAAFNVFIPPASATVFVHISSVDNISYNYTYIDSSLTNNTPNAVLLVTSNWNPGNIGGTYNDHAVGVWYDTSVGKWAIYNQDMAAMPVDAAFNIMVLDN